MRGARVDKEREEEIGEQMDERGARVDKERRKYRR
jgi:hypothetical protein